MLTILAVIVAVVLTADTLCAGTVTSFLKRRLKGRVVRFVALLIAISFAGLVIIRHFVPVVIAIVTTTFAVYFWERRSEVKSFFSKVKNRTAETFDQTKDKVLSVLDKE